MKHVSDFGMGKMPYGGDYYPEQWERSVWDEDIGLFREAGIDMLTVNIFAWTLDQPGEDRYDFAWLDELFALFNANGMRVCLGTGTGAHPSWMAQKYPDILRTDFQGRKRKYGDRHNSCPSSPAYRRFAPALAGALASRYKNEKAIALWHVSNEFGGACYCLNCERAFRAWLAKRYGTLDALNAAWNARFWSQTITDWDQISVPNVLTVQWGDRNTAVQGISLDYLRFNSENMLDCYTLERDAIKREIPDAIVTTNLMGAYRQLDYRKWAKRMDVVSWDNYPRFEQPASVAGFSHDLMRGLKDGEPFLLMEQTPSQTNWQDYNALKRPRVMRLLSYQAIAHGADSVLFFQMRNSRGACEKFHGAVISHSGRSDTRVFREVAELGRELKLLGDALIGSRIDAKVAIWFDWECYWASENSMGPSIALRYPEEVGKYYDAFHSLGIQVDMVGPETDISKYKLIVAPVMYMLHPDTAARIETFVRDGGTFLATCMSGVADESDLVFRGGAPGPLKGILGLRVEETDALPPSHKNTIRMKEKTSTLSRSYECSLLYDVVRLEGAVPLAEYGSDFYAGKPVLTKNVYGKGSAYYLASSPEAEFLRDLFAGLCASCGVNAVLDSIPEGVEVTRRTREDGKGFVFVLNHGKDKVEVDLGKNERTDLLSGKKAKGKWILAPCDVLILEE